MPQSGTRPNMLCYARLQSCVTGTGYGNEMRLHMLMLMLMLMALVKDESHASSRRKDTCSKVGR